jgi:hypothetical protein
VSKRKRKPDFLDAVRATRAKLAEQGITFDASEYMAERYPTPARRLTQIADDARACADSIPSPLLAARVRVLAEELAVIAVQIEEREKGEVK